MLQETVDRLDPLIKREDVYVIAGRKSEKVVREQLEWLPAGNFVGEPVGKNTAPAIGVIATIINRIDPDGVIVVLPADHVIAKRQQFRHLLEVAEQVAKEGPNVVTIGIKPNAPETGYGYIEMSETHRSIGDVDVYKAVSFKEKPDAHTAEEYVASWRYVWNGGMFIWTARTIMNLYRDHSPDIYKLMIRLDGALGTTDESRVYDEVYDAFPSISVDYAIMEHAKHIYVIPASVGWSDVGCWSSLHEIMGHDDFGNSVVGEHVGVDTHNCMIVGSDRLVATIGLDNLIIVDAGDSLLVMPSGRSQDVKQVLDELKKQGKTKFL